MLKSEFFINGKAASARDLAEAQALARQHTAKLARIEREALEGVADAKRVAAAIRRAHLLGIDVRPAFVSGSRRGGVRLRAFESQLRLLLPVRASKVGSNGLSSFHLRFTPRGLGNKRRAKDRPYKRGEAVRAVRYILRDAAREIDGGGIVSNISQNPDDIASFFAAVEELELVAGRVNANVFVSAVTSLPHEPDAARRETLLGEICRPLAALNLPFVAVLHSPDPEGDQRNFHAHIIFSWRPFEHRLGGYALASSTLGASNTAEFTKSFRQNAAAAMNRTMALGGHTRRFTAEKLPRSAPAPEGSQKLTAGTKHHQRRNAGIERARAERSWVGERAATLSDIERQAESWLARVRPDRIAVI